MKQSQQNVMQYMQILKVQRMDIVLFIILDQMMRVDKLVRGGGLYNSHVPSSSIFSHPSLTTTSHPPNILLSSAMVNIHILLHLHIVFLYKSEIVLLKPFNNSAQGKQQHGSLSVQQYYRSC
jgi:hypothetical protein